MRWADWTVTLEQAQSLLAPYQQRLSGAFGGFVSETPDAVEKYLRERADYLPLIALLNRDAAFAPQCEKMPEGLPGDLARLMTPIDAQPFATERYLGHAVKAWVLLAEADPDASAAAIDHAFKRLQHDLHLTPRDLAPTTTAATKSTKPK